MDDTPPGLRDRIEALDATPTVPDWLRGNALALLGEDAKRWVKHFDKQWCRDNASEWKQHHAWLVRVRARAEALAASTAQSSAAELVELARLKTPSRPPLARCAPLTRCWLVRKNLREHPQRRAYLVFMELPGIDDESRYQLCRSMERNLSLPGPALALWAGESPSLEEIQRYAFEPVYTR